MTDKPEAGPRLLATIQESCAQLSISKSTLYLMLKDSEIKSVRIRGKQLIPRAELERIAAVSP